MTYVEKRQPRFVRSRNGSIAGVCTGIARSLNMDPTIIKLLWILSVLVFGTGLLLYLFLALMLPYEDAVEMYERPKFLGVCSRIGENYGHEVALIRILFVMSFFFSGGLTILFYLGLYLFLPEHSKWRYYR